MALIVQLDDGAFKPTRGHFGDAGYDLYTPIDATVPARQSVVIDTGVHVKIPERCAGKIISKSGLNVKYGLIADGLIDRGYTGSIKVKLYNLSDEDYTFKRGEKITQLTIIKVWLPEDEKDAVVVDSICESVDGRGDNGFGSTGKQYTGD